MWSLLQWYCRYVYENWIVLVIFCCIEIIPKLNNWEKQMFVITQFLWVKNSGAALLSDSGPGSPSRCKCGFVEPLGLQLSQLLCQEQVHVQAHGRSLWPPPGFPGSTWSDRERGNSSHKPPSCYNLILEVPCHHCCHIFLLRNKSASRAHNLGWWPHKGIRAGGGTAFQVPTSGVFSRGHASVRWPETIADLTEPC